MNDEPADYKEYGKLYEALDAMTEQVRQWTLHHELTTPNLQTVIANKLDKLAVSAKTAAGVLRLQAEDGERT